MTIVGERPETGVRIALERSRDGGPPWAYAGAAVLPDASYPLTVVVSHAGEVAVELGPAAFDAAAATSAAAGSPPPSDLAEKVRLIVRTAYRQAIADDEPPPWRIIRWRAL